MLKFVTNRPTAFTLTDHDTALEKLIKELHSDPTRTWNSVELHKLYEELGGKQLSRRSLINYLGKTLHPDLLVLYSPSVASILLFRSNASANLRIVDDVEDDCNQAISSLGKKIKSECLAQKPDTSTYVTHISLDSVTGECSQTLLALVAEISPKLQFTLPAAMIGNIVLSAVCDQVTSLQVALSTLFNQQRSVIDQLHSFGVTSSN
ncbi:PREDICTED: uncharacterized protein LOC106812453 [Priapulus caudatus]|uniref:Uncharacterized protein LOC106812453 n=1 Tax=Priapulus caudatus TaxID=37621 RepID=A0ABM1EI02_PRICU|nr:PREDICTED: uncharacterized protein LOC106812453 [Priapulus caudatus]